MKLLKRFLESAGWNFLSSQRGLESTLYFISTQNPNLHKIPENHSLIQLFGTLKIVCLWFLRVTYGLFLLKKRLSRWDWPKGKIAWSIAILAVTGRCFVKSRIILQPVRLSSVIYLPPLQEVRQSLFFSFIFWEIWFYVTSHSIYCS